MSFISLLRSLSLSWLCAGLWLELLGKHRSRQDKCQTGKRGGPQPAPALEGTQLSSTSLHEHRPQNHYSERQTRAGSGLLCPWAALDAKQLPGSIASLPLPSPHAHAGTELVTAGGSSDASGRGERPGTSLRAAQVFGGRRGQASRWTRRGGSDIAGAGSALSQGCPQPTACPAAWPALGPCCSASPVLCAAAARWERPSFLTG